MTIIFGLLSLFAFCVAYWWHEQDKKDGPPYMGWQWNPIIWIDVIIGIICLVVAVVSFP